MFHNDWITYNYKDLTINEYPNKDFSPTTFQDALTRQAKVISNDVKPTVFLSGGIDSSAIVSLMRQCGQNKIGTFSLSFEDGMLNESVYSRQV